MGGQCKRRVGAFLAQRQLRHTQSDEKFHSETDGQTLSVRGLQVIGFVNHLISKAPNPLPEIKDTDFV